MPVINQLVMLKQTAKQPLVLRGHYQNMNLIVWPMKKRLQHLFVKKKDSLIDGMRMFLSAYTDALIFRSFKFKIYRNKFSSWCE